MSTVQLSNGTIADVVQDILFPLQCEWKMPNGCPCGIILSSYQLLKKHLSMHCNKGKTHNTSNWLCKLPKCNMPVHSSSKALNQHVQLSHMSRILLPCPFASCTNTPNMRITQLPNHFDDEHDELDGKTVTIPSTLFQPLWMPFTPTQIPSLESLPKHTFPGTCLTEPVKLRPTARQNGAAVASKATKRQRRQLSEKIDDEAPVPSLSFDTLESTNAEAEVKVPIHHSELIHPREESKAQMMHGFIQAQVKSITIHYKVLAQRMEAAERMG